MNMNMATQPEEERKPTICIEGDQLEALNLGTVEVGQTYQLHAMATISCATQYKEGEGEVCNMVTFELSSIKLDSGKTDLSKMYPNSK